MADKEPAGSQDEPTPADDLVDPATPNRDAEPTADLEPVDPGRYAAGDVDETPAELVDIPAELAEETDAEGNGSTGVDREPATVGAAATGTRRGASKVSLGDTGATSGGKGRSTRRRDAPEPAHKRTGPVTFVRESVGELRKVVYPTGQQLVNYFVVVLIFVLFIIAYVSLLDLGFGAAMFRIFA